MRTFLFLLLACVCSGFSSVSFAKTAYIPPTALSITVNGEFPGVNSRLEKHVYRVISTGIRQNLFDRFIVQNRSSKGFTGCLQVNTEASARQVESIEKKLKAIRIDLDVNTYSVEHLTTCDSTTAACEIGGEKLAMASIESGNSSYRDSAIETPRQAVLKESEAWSQLWREHFSNFSEPPALPAVDFANKMVLAVYIGARPSGAYSVAIQSVEKLDNRIMVKYQESIYDGVAATVITYPSDMVIVDRSDLPIEFVNSPDRFVCE